MVPVELHNFHFRHAFLSILAVWRQALKTVVVVVFVARGTVGEAGLIKNMIHIVVLHLASHAPGLVCQTRFEELAFSSA